MDEGLRAAVARHRRRIATAAPRVAVLHGPASVEDRAYYRRTDATGRSHLDVCRALEDLGAGRVEPVDVTASACWTEAARAADLAVVNLHGEPGEDGTVQGLLRLHGVPFVGSDVEASVIGLNKLLGKLVARSAGIRTPDHLTLADGVVLQCGPRPPAGDLIAKPLRGGSSIGTARLRPGAAWPPFGEWLVEQYLPGEDVTVTVVEDAGRALALPAVVLEHDGDVYAEEGKLGARARATRPAHLQAALAECQAMAAAVHRLIGARHVSRSDFVVHDGRPWFLEINTLPGLSRVSNAAECAYAAGLGYEDLIALVVGPALPMP